MKRLLIVEDKESLALMLQETVASEGLEADVAANGSEAINRLAAGRRYFAVLTDLRLPGADGIAVLKQARENDPDCPVIVMTAFGTIENAVEAMKLGAFDFVQKPIDVDHLLLLLRRCREMRELQYENLLLKEEFQQRYRLPAIIGDSPKIVEVSSAIQRVAPGLHTVAENPLLPTMLTDTSRAEVAYLRAFSLEQAGRRDEAFAAYLAIPDGIDSYYGWLATERLPKLNDTANTVRVDDRIDDVNRAIAKVADQYPAPYRQAILSAAKARRLDPRFILALIKQESVFKPLAKSPAGARGLLQLTMDAAQKYMAGAGLNSLRENQLYQPDTSIALGAEYLKQLTDMFPQMLEPVAASYNGGEDNVVRWLERSKQKDPGVFTAEIGFDETKGYVQKVMSNYRVYRQLYTPDLIRKQ